MAGQAFPFCAFPPRCLPGGHFPGLSHGHCVYRGAGGIARVDFARPVGYAQAGASVVRLAGLGHTSLTRYTYVVRPVAGAAWLETPDLSNACEMETDATGQWLGSRPAGVEWLSASAGAGGSITVRWSYHTPPGRPAPTDFAVYCTTGPRTDIGEPSAVVSYVRDGIASHTLELDDGRSYWFTVTVRTGSAESHTPRPVGPVVADASIPAAPSIVVTRSF